MPFFRRGSNKGADYKARLEHKLYLARENPDPVFDLSDCDLKAVPSGVYSLCRVFRKESLYLQKNNLSALSGGGTFEDLSLLLTLDIRFNNLTNLPDGIRHLKKLQELYVDNNLLKTLPDCIGELADLRVLSCCCNKLRKIPPSVGQLSSLERLALEGNPGLCHLPPELSRCAALSSLVIDLSRYIQPPDEVVQQGTPAVLSHLAHLLGEEYHGVEAKSQAMAIPRHLSPLETRDREIQEKLKRVEKAKEEKLQERLAVEKEISKQKDEEYKLHNIMKVGKNKLMEDLVKQQSKIAEEVMRFQSKKEAERAKLVDQLHQVEQSADEVIGRMLALNRSLREPSRVLRQEELDQAAQEQLFAKYSQGNLRRAEVISAMESLLKEEEMQREKMREYEERKAEVVRNTLTREEEWEDAVAWVVEVGGSRRRHIAEEVAQDERVQVAAVAALLERSDLESCRLRAQLRLIEHQLAALTAIELRRNHLNLNQLQCDVSEKRSALSHLLVEVLREHEDRKKHLLKTLRRMERFRLEENGDEDYWLVQYQRLLDSASVLKPALVQGILARGVGHLLPLLASVNVETLDCQTLQELGVENEAERQAVLGVLESLNPSAPAEEMPSAPPLSPECVVCMESQCEVVFVPCGHLCCCGNCGMQLELCPLCRGQLERKVTLIPA